MAAENNMSIQNTLDNYTISRLDRIKELIDKADQFESNQMRCYTLKQVMNSMVEIDDMSKRELASFEDKIIRVFKAKEWI
jgi:hypothetical protein